MRKFLLMMIMLGLFPILATAGEQGGFLLGVNAFRYTHAASYASVNVAEASATHTDLKFGYITSIGLYLGVQYSSFNDYSTSTTTSTETRTGSGLTLGYRVSGFYLDYTILLASQFSRANGSSFSGGSGYIAEVGYNAMMGSHFYLGLGVVSKAFNWNESTSAAGVKTLANNSHNDYYPSLNIGFMF